MPSRRQILGAGLGLPVVLAASTARVRALEKVREARPPADLDDPAAAAGDEAFWAWVRDCYTIDTSIVNFNNGGVSPATADAQAAQKRFMDQTHRAPAYHLWRLLEPQSETVRTRLARYHGVDAEEIAITRNASESLMTLLFGHDLRRGDEVLCTEHDYPRMLETLRQRERREGIRLVTFDPPVPLSDPDALVAMYAERITERTKLILVSHMVYLTGQVFPVRAIAKLGRERGIPVIVDGAHAIFHMDFRLVDLDVDFYGASLHKWLCGPLGTGLLYARREKIASVWPLMAANEVLDSDIRKFEQIGTHPEDATLGLTESLDLHETIGGARKHARLVRLRDRWADRLLEHDRVRLHTHRGPSSAGAIANLAVDGIEPGKLQAHLWREHRIYTVAILHEGCEGLRVSPHVYSTLDEVDRFSEAVEDVLANGLPS
ncbi:MAG: aminotransferase class V-fold PLP-dependent enzyme [Planctomycetota bacterium]